jgi:type VI secretion system protein VasJ
MGRMGAKLMSFPAEKTIENGSEILLKKLLKPIGESGVGEDPRYGDNFSAVKAEIDRLSDIDYTKVKELCEKILSEESKDLRVAGYYLLAKVFTEGIHGFIEGVSIYVELLAQYGDRCHPHREMARLQAISWLNNDKFTAFVKSIVIDNEQDRHDVVKLKKLLDSLNEQISANFDDSTEVLKNLNSWINKNSPIETPQVTSLPEGSKDKLPLTVNDKKEIASDLEFTRTVDELLSYIEKQEDILRLVAIARAIKWSNAVLPPDENGVTKVPPPRDAVISEVETVNAKDVTDKKLFLVESYFMESGCSYWFDLQRYEYELALLAGRKDLASLIKAQVQQYIDRQPEILRLSFSDGKPFANELTRRWVTKDVKATKSADNEMTGSSDLQSCIDNVTEQGPVLGLAKSIEMLSKIKVKDSSEKFQVELAMLDLCLNAGRSDIALPLAEKLESEVERYRLFEWDKQKALELWDKLLLIMQQNQSLDQDEKLRIIELKGKICATDLGFALRAF